MSKVKHSINFKAQVAIAAVKEESTIVEIAQKYSVHPTLVKRWKKELLDTAHLVFDDKKKKIKTDSPELAALERKVGQLAIENDFLKKKLNPYQ